MIKYVAFVFIVIVLIFIANRFFATVTPVLPERSVAPDVTLTSQTEFFADSVPASGTLLTAVPHAVALHFTDNLVDPSHVHIQFLDDLVALDLTEEHHDEYGDGDTIIDVATRTMTRAMKLDAPPGIYRVKYKHCVQKYSCDIGNFFFKIASL